MSVPRVVFILKNVAREIADNVCCVCATVQGLVYDAERVDLPSFEAECGEFCITKWLVERMGVGFDWKVKPRLYICAAGDMQDPDERDLLRVP